MIRGSRLTVAQWFGLSVSVLFVIAAAGLIAGIVALGRLTERVRLLADRIDPAAIAALQFLDRARRRGDGRARPAAPAATMRSWTRIDAPAERSRVRWRTCAGSSRTH